MRVVFDTNILVTLTRPEEADYIVTADKDLLVVGEYKGIQIITRTEFGKLQL